MADGAAVVQMTPLADTKRDMVRGRRRGWRVDLGGFDVVRRMRWVKDAAPYVIGCILLCGPIIAGGIAYGTGNAMLGGI